MKLSKRMWLVLVSISVVALTAFVVTNRAMMTEYSVEFAGIAVSLPTNSTASNGTTVVIPVMVGDTTNQNIFSYDFTVTFDPNVLQPASPVFDTTGTVSGAAGFTITPNTATSGQLTISGFGSQPLSGQGTLIFLRFNVVGTAGTATGSTNLTFTTFMFNEGVPMSMTTNGVFTVTGVMPTPTPTPTPTPCNTTLTEGFDDITTLIPNGWARINNSQPLGTTNWFQGIPAVFPSQSGAPNSYIAANFQNTGTTGTISNWLLTPSLTLQNGDQLSFFTRQPLGSTFPDRLQVRMSLNGASTDVGMTATSVGDFATLLLDINPTYIIGVYPQVFTQFTVTLSGIGSPTTGRLAFRYFVEDAGLSGANSDYIGIDTVSFCGQATPTATPLGGNSVAAYRLDFSGELLSVPREFNLEALSPWFSWRLSEMSLLRQGEPVPEKGLLAQRDEWSAASAYLSKVLFGPWQKEFTTEAEREVARLIRAGPEPALESSRLLTL